MKDHGMFCFDGMLLWFVDCSMVAYFSLLGG